MFCKKTVFKNFAIFTGKRLCWSLFNTGASCEYCKFFKNTYFEKHLQTAVSRLSQVNPFSNGILHQTHNHFKVSMFLKDY